MKPALAPEMEFQHVSQNLYVFVAKRRQAERAILFGIFFVSYSNVSCFEKLHDSGQDFSLRQTTAGEIASNNTPNTRKNFSKGAHPVEFDEVAHVAIFGVVTILFPATCVSADGLNMTVRIRVNPNRSPSRRNN